MILNYPETETSILSSLKEYHTTIDTEQYDSDFLAKYGYEKKDFDNEISKTDFGTWAYQKYRQLQEMHITCRSWFRLAKEDERMLKGLEVT